jgi:hypothetical protein
MLSGVQQLRGVSGRVVIHQQRFESKVMAACAGLQPLAESDKPGSSLAGRSNSSASLSLPFMYTSSDT